MPAVQQTWEPTLVCNSVVIGSPVVVVGVSVTVVVTGPDVVVNTTVMRLRLHRGLIHGETNKTEEDLEVEL